jgi:hypothetical protein
MGILPRRCGSFVFDSRYGRLHGDSRANCSHVKDVMFQEG